jgi:hypothetical protein
MQFGSANLKCFCSFRFINSLPATCIMLKNSDLCRLKYILHLRRSLKEISRIIAQYLQLTVHAFIRTEILLPWKYINKWFLYINTSMEGLRMLQFLEHAKEKCES